MNNTAKYYRRLMSEHNLAAANMVAERFPKFETKEAAQTEMEKRAIRNCKPKWDYYSWKSKPLEFSGNYIINRVCYAADVKLDYDWTPGGRRFKAVSCTHYPILSEGN